VAAFDIGCRGLVAAVASGPDGGRGLILWQMNSPLDITCLHILPIAVDGDISMKIDEEYITIFIKQQSKETSCLTYCLSTKTLQVEYCTTLSKFDEIFYEKGHLIVYSKSEIR
jgi:hypothetical protein